MKTFSGLFLAVVLFAYPAAAQQVTGPIGPSFGSNAPLSNALIAGDPQPEPCELHIALPVDNYAEPANERPLCRSAEEVNPKMYPKPWAPDVAVLNDFDALDAQIEVFLAGGTSVFIGNAYMCNELLPQYGEGEEAIKGFERITCEVVR